MIWICALLLLLTCSAPHAGTASSSAPEPASCSDAGCQPARALPGTPVSIGPASSAPVGARCETALRLAGSGDSSALLESRGAAPALGCAPALGAAGAYFVLDLSEARGPLPVLLVFDSPVPLEVGLARGACGDLRLEQCALPLYADQRSRVISTTLEPDRYLLLVDSAVAGAPLHVSASVDGLSCSTAPTNDECATAQPLDPLAPVQSVSGTLACAHPSASVRCGSFEAADVFYTLDLSDRPGETLLDVEVTAASNHPVTGALFGSASDGCGELWMCGAQFSARVPPGIYRLGVSASDGPPYSQSRPTLPDLPDGEPGPFALRIGLGASDCSQTPNDSWQTAIDLDPAAERQTVQGDTACGADLLRGACFGDRGAPELYYRLDLRGAPGPRVLEARSLLGTDTVNYMVLADPAGGAPRFTSCDRYFQDYAAYYLAPRLYYLVVDGRVRNAARFELDLRMSDQPQRSQACVDYEVESCMADSEPACSDSMANPGCFASAVECGLEQSAYDAFCSGTPGCCSGTEAAEVCLQAWQSTVQCR